MKTSTLLLLVSITAGGCQSARKTTLTAQTPATTQSDLSAGAATAPVTPRVVAVAPATTPASTAPAIMPVGNYVAADADEATRFRNWPVSVNGYPSGRALAGPVYRIKVAPPKSDKLDDVVVQDLFATLIVPGQMLATPIWMLFTKPNTPVVYHGETFAPSYNVDQPLPYYQDENVPGIIKMKR